MSKINVIPVAASHLETLRDYQTDRRSIADYVLFFGVPCCAAAVLVYFRYGYRTDAVNGLLNAFAILTGLLLNLLVLVFTLASAAPPLNLDIRMRKVLLREIFSNVCFALLVSIGLVCTAIVALSYMRSELGAVTGPLATFLLTALTANFIMTLLMIIKRMYVLLDKELERANPNSARKSA